MLNFLHGLHWGLLFLAITASCFYLTCIVVTIGFWWRRQNQPLAQPLPVSILIPVRGIDEGALANWQSFCIQDYPSYEVLFGVMDPADPAVPLLQKLVAQFPEKTKLLVDLPPRGINHKISNLSYLIEAAKYEQVILADSDIRVTPTYLQEVTLPLADPSVGIVTCGYLDKSPEYIGAAIAALGRGIDFLPSILIARQIDRGLKFALGPTIATKKSVLTAIDGLAIVMNRIGIDLLMGKLAAEAGYRVELSNYVLDNNCGHESIQQVFLRELRWARTIRIIRGGQYYGLLLTYGTIYAALILLLPPYQAWEIPVLVGVYSIRLVQALISIQALRSPKLLQWWWAIPLRDLLSFLIWVGGGYGQRIFWRGRWLNVGQSGVLHEKP